jgi:hypothetical protein
MTVKTDGVRTSESHPITLSVVMICCGRLSLCYCPGKNVVRDGVKWQRDLEVITAVLGGSTLCGPVSYLMDGCNLTLIAHYIMQEDLNRLKTVHGVDTIGEDAAFSENDHVRVFKTYCCSLPLV